MGGMDRTEIQTGVGVGGTKVRGSGTGLYLKKWWDS